MKKKKWKYMQKYEKLCKKYEEIYRNMQKYAKI